MRVISLLILAVLITPAVAAEPASSGIKNKTPATVPAPPPPPENYNPPAAPELPDVGQPDRRLAGQDLALLRGPVEGVGQARQPGHVAVQGVELERQGLALPAL